MARLSVGYSRDRETGGLDAERATREHLGRGYKVPNGGIYSTVGDLARFAAALMGAGPEPILSAESREEIFTLQGPADGYGLGFSVRERAGMRIVGHGGSVAGYNADLAFEPVSGLGVAMLRTSSYDPPTRALLERLARARDREWTEEEREAEGLLWLESRRTRRVLAERLRSMEEAVERGDMAAVAMVYADDAVIVGPGVRVEGREAIDEYWQGLEGPVSWRLDIDRTTGRGDAVHQTGRSTLVHRSNGVERTSVVDFMLAWHRGEDGQWRIVVDSFHDPR